MYPDEQPARDLEIAEEKIGKLEEEIVGLKHRAAHEPKTAIEQFIDGELQEGCGKPQAKPTNAKAPFDVKSTNSIVDYLIANCNVARRVAIANELLKSGNPDKKRWDDDEGGTEEPPSEPKAKPVKQQAKRKPTLTWTKLFKFYHSAATGKGKAVYAIQELEGSGMFRTSYNPRGWKKNGLNGKNQEDIGGDVKLLAEAKVLANADWQQRK
jgi:hypothetical protein